VKKKSPNTESREKLVASAEALFSNFGFNGVSVRDIANEAGVNSALVGYYFGSKQGLLAEVYDRHAKPLNAERLRLLSEFRNTGPGLTLEKVLEAFIRPSLEVTTDESGRSSFTRLRAILSGENSALLEQLVSANFDKSIRKFVDEISAFVPDLRREEVFWRFHFLVGTIYYTGSGPHRIHALTKGVCNTSDPVATANEMIPFLAAGFRAPGRPAPSPLIKAKAVSRKRPRTQKI
jgi:AcrR family transcriptional regulator